jgi:hypothetical protein
MTDIWTAYGSLEAETQYWAEAYGAPPADTTRVTGTLVVDLTGIDPNDLESTMKIRQALGVVRAAPTGATVRLILGRIHRWHEWMTDGLALKHVYIVVESDDPAAIRHWVTALRGVAE